MRRGPWTPAPSPWRTAEQVRSGADGRGAADKLFGAYDQLGWAQDIFAYAAGLLPMVHALTLAADKTVQIIQPAPEGSIEAVLTAI